MSMHQQGWTSYTRQKSVRNGARCKVTKSFWDGNDGLHRTVTLDRPKLAWLLPLWLLTFSTDIMAYYYDTYEHLARNVFIVFDCLLMYKLMRMAVDRWNMDWLMKISKVSFFIYLFHEPWLGYLQGLSFKFIHPSGLVGYLMPWLFCLLAVAYSYIAYMVFKKICPKLLNVMTGAR